jgi:hypothetical protein
MLELSTVSLSLHVVMRNFSGRGPEDGSMHAGLAHCLEVFLLSAFSVKILVKSSSDSSCVTFTTHIFFEQS